MFSVIENVQWRPLGPFIIKMIIYNKDNQYHCLIYHIGDSIRSWIAMCRAMPSLRVGLLNYCILIHRFRYTKQMQTFLDVYLKEETIILKKIMYELQSGVS